MTIAHPHHPLHHIFLLMSIERVAASPSLIDDEFYHDPAAH
jgi:hypothetical protein